MSHTHAVLLDGATIETPFDSTLVKGARHIFTQSVIIEGVFSIFDIADIQA
jgi:hypothetical protein